MLHNFYILFIAESIAGHIGTYATYVETSVA